MAAKRVRKKTPKPKKTAVTPVAPQVQKKLSLFPNIYRFITESWKLIMVSFVSGLILIAIAIQSVSLYHNLQEVKKLSADRKNTVAELKHWKQVVAKYKNYRDGYLKIATFEYKLGDIDEAKINLKKTLELDPNFEKARQMEKVLNSDGKP